MTPPDEVQPDIGSLLRQKRMKRGQSLEAIHQHTRIPKKFLEALEANQIENFPAPVYLRGFLKGYCDYLDLDFDVIWKQILSRCAKPILEAKKEDVLAPRLNGTTPILLPFTESTLLPFSLVFVLLIVGTGMWLWTRQETLSETRQRQPVPARSVHLLSPSHDALPATPMTKELSLDLTAVQATWMQLKVDGVLRFEGHMPIGVTQRWQAKKNYSLRASDLKSLKIQLDGQQISLAQLAKISDGSYVITQH